MAFKIVITDTDTGKTLTEKENCTCVIGGFTTVDGFGEICVVDNCDGYDVGRALALIDIATEHIKEDTGFNDVDLALLKMAAVMEMENARKRRLET